jgi:hypothetical protein
MKFSPPTRSDLHELRYGCSEVQGKSFSLTFVATTGLRQTYLISNGVKQSLKRRDRRYCDEDSMYSGDRRADDALLAVSTPGRHSGARGYWNS